MSSKAAPHIAFKSTPTFEHFQAFEEEEHHFHTNFNLYSRMVVTEREILESKTRLNRFKKIFRKTWDRIPLRRTKIFSGLVERREAHNLSFAAKSSKLAKTYRARASFDRFSRSRSNTIESSQSSVSTGSTNHCSHEDVRPKSRDLLHIRTFESVLRTPKVEPENGNVLTHSPATTETNARASSTTLVRTTTNTTTASFTTALEKSPSFPRTSNEESIPLVTTTLNSRQPRPDRRNSNKMKRFSGIRIEGRKQVLLDMDRRLADEKAPLGKSWLKGGGGILLNQGPKRKVHIDSGSLDSRPSCARLEKGRD
ncbi:MAG: hypothetical protein LQ351_003809 [Letrouitia transgressa]|nr:MAG: hypothetical protein LQ351_003809 [Letrouitia transgressa]